jgi:FkbM family methyltransferase
MKGHEKGKRLHKRVANALGYDLVPIRKNHQTVERHLAHLLDRYEVDLVLDVGANLGQFARTLRAVGYTGWIVSFEPVSATFARLSTELAADPRWRGRQLALGREPGRAEIKVLSNSDLSSFRTPHERALARHPREFAMTQREEVTIATVDDLLPGILEETGARRVFLKMDTQGFDLEVFRGALRSLASVCGVMSELSFDPIYEDIPRFDQALLAYMAEGYRLTGLYPVLRNREDLTVIEFDGVLVRPATLGAAASQAP